VTPGFLRKIFGAVDGTASPEDFQDESTPATRGLTYPERNSFPR
jgi:hypothetical protein